MSEWNLRRFWTAVDLDPVEGGFQVALDGKPVRTPGKMALVLPTRALADAVADEWRGVEGAIDPGRMPVTRAANSAIEKVTPQFDAVAGMLAEYGGTDLLSYRDDRQDALAREQAQAWDPILNWAADTLGARLAVTAGVIPVTQDAAALAALRGHVQALDPWGLTALHDLVTLPGSLILGLAVIHGRLTADQAHDLSRLDEEYQARQWGRDAEADAAAATRRAALQAAGRFWELSRDA